MCIDLILINDLHTFQSICVIETGLLDFDFQGYLDLTLTIVKKHLKNRGLESLIIGHLNIFHF